VAEVEVAVTQGAAYAAIKPEAAGHSGEQHRELIDQQNDIFTATVVDNAAYAMADHDLPRKIALQHTPRENECIDPRPILG
jgi:hypothetical protein